MLVWVKRSPAALGWQALRPLRLVLSGLLLTAVLLAGTFGFVGALGGAPAALELGRAIVNMSASERLFYTLMGAKVAFAEETVFRGLLRRQPLTSLMLHAREGRITPRPELIDQGLGVRVIVDADHQVYVSREAHLGANRHCEALDERIADPRVRVRYRSQPGHAEERAQPSLASHAASSWSTSCSLDLGKRCRSDTRFKAKRTDIISSACASFSSGASARLS